MRQVLESEEDKGKALLPPRSGWALQSQGLNLIPGGLGFLQFPIR